MRINLAGSLLLGAISVADAGDFCRVTERTYVIQRGDVADFVALVNAGKQTEAISQSSACLVPKGAKAEIIGSFQRERTVSVKVGDRFCVGKVLVDFLAC